MLQRLLIKNIALIDNIEIDFSEGLNILTGETGAGKSIIIDSINAVLGDRVSKDIIRTGQNNAYVEAFFDVNNKQIKNFLEQNELDDEEASGVILSRELNVSGKNICRINGRAVSVNMLKEIGQYLVDIHGQHDNQSLLNRDTHIDLLDSFGSQKINEIKNEYFQLFEQYKNIERQIKELGGNGAERERKLDLLTYQLDEILAAKLKLNEEEELEHQRNIMNNSSKMTSGIENAYDILYSGNKNNSVLESINAVIKELSNISRYDTNIENMVSKIENIYYSAEDVVEEIRNYKENLDFDPSLLEQINERLNIIFKLKRKYGSNINEILEYKDNLQREVEELKNSEQLLVKYSAQLEELNNNLHDKAIELSENRKRMAEILEEKIVGELEDLQMKKTQFKVNFKDNLQSLKYSQKGIDEIEFLISPNAGEALKPLPKIASGGEMSRIMLAIKTILANVDQVPTLIFDEIDIGISGAVGSMVAQKLSIISKKHQVICITHLPQIASMSDYHYLIEKSVENDHTKTNVIKLNYEQKKNEIARIIGGVKITDTTLKNAEEMIVYAQRQKQA